MHSKDYWNLQSGCRVNMSRCRNFPVFSFVMVSNNKKSFDSIWLDLTRSTNDPHGCCPHRNIWVRMCCCCRLPANKIQTVNTGGSIWRLLKTNINTSQFVTSSSKILCSEKSFHILHFLYIFKANWTELIDESANVCLHFSGHVTSQSFTRVLSFCWNSRCIYFL